MKLRAAVAPSAQWMWLAVLAACASCARTKHDAAQPSAAAAPLPLPVTAFVAPATWKPLRGGAQPVPAPDLAKLTWYVLVDQYEPHQVETPRWQPLPATETVEVKMPRGSTLRCVAGPLEIEPVSDDLRMTLEAWFLSRSVLCSADGFRTWTSFPHRLRLLPDGREELDYRSDGWLSERAAAGTTRNTVVSLRAHEPRREATTGPPRVLPPQGATSQK